MAERIVKLFSKFDFGADSDWWWWISRAHFLRRSALTLSLTMCMHEEKKHSNDRNICTYNSRIGVCELLYCCMLNVQYILVIVYFLWSVVLFPLLTLRLMIERAIYTSAVVCVCMYAESTYIGFLCVPRVQCLCRIKCECSSSAWCCAYVRALRERESFESRMVVRLCVRVCARCVLRVCWWQFRWLDVKMCAHICVSLCVHLYRFYVRKNCFCMRIEELFFFASLPLYSVSSWPYTCSMYICLCAR